MKLSLFQETSPALKNSWLSHWYRIKNYFNELQTGVVLKTILMN